MAVAYIGPKNTRQVLGAAPYFWWQELDQTMPLGRWRGIATGGDLVFQENTHATIQFSTTDEWLRFDESADAIVTSKAITLTGGMIVPDDALLRWGTSGDVASVLRSTALTANTALTNVLAGTPVSAATPANSFLLSNITVDADIALFTLLGGTNSAEIMRVDTSAGVVVWNEPGLSDLDHRWEGTGNANLLMLDWGLAGVGIGASAASGIRLNVSGIASFSTTLVSVTGANSTSNTSVLIENSSNAAAASHAYLELRVGGATSLGDAYVEFTVADIRSWHAGLDNSDGDKFKVGVGSVVGTTTAITLSPSVDGSALGMLLTPPGTISAASGASSWYRLLDARGAAHAYTGATQVTALIDWAYISGPTYASNTATLTIDAATTLALLPPIDGTNVTLTIGSALRITDAASGAGTLTNRAALVIDAMTAGATGNYALLLANGGGAYPALANYVGLVALDNAAGDARLYIIPELGTAIKVGGSAIQSDSATEMAFCVTNGALTVGTLGSLVIPVKTDTGAPNDAAAGNLDGSFAFNSFDNTLEIRDGVDTYLSVGVAGYVIQRQAPVIETGDGWYHNNQRKGQRHLVDETICVVCGEQMQVGDAIAMWANGNIRNNDLHAIFGHLHPERDSYVQQLERRIAELETKLEAICR